jgi:DNA-binding transcriptional LysR family regulator
MTLVSVAALCCSSEMKSEFREWSDIRIFLAVLREGSTLAASRRLGIAQPTVARRIDVLEHVTGLVLFDRSNRGFAPTDAAMALLPAAEAMETAARDIEEGARRQARALARPILFTTANVAMTRNLTGIVAAFRELHPEVAFEFVSTARTLDLAAGEADVALRYAYAITDERLVAQKLSSIRSGFFASEGYAARHGLPARPEEALGHSFAIYGAPGSHSGTRLWLDEAFGDRISLTQCDDIESVFAMIETDGAIGYVPRVGAARHGGLLRCFDPPDPVTTRTWLVSSAAAARRPEVRAFTEFFAPRYRAFLRAERKELLGSENWDDVD